MRLEQAALPVGGSIPGSVEGESVSVLANWNELNFGSHIEMIVFRVGRIIYQWALVYVRGLEIATCERAHAHVHR